VNLRIGILDAHDHSSDARIDDGVRAGTRPTVVRTWLQSDHQSCAPSGGTGLFESDNLCVTLSGGLRGTTADNHAVGRKEYGAYAGVRRGASTCIAA
jgi:hypothetical protein